jgi:hypothetical protein
MVKLTAMSQTPPASMSLDDVMVAMGLNLSKVKPVHTQHKVRRLVDRRAETIVVPVHNKGQALEPGIRRPREHLDRNYHRRQWKHRPHPRDRFVSEQNPCRRHEVWVRSDRTPDRPQILPVDSSVMVLLADDRSHQNIAHPEVNGSWLHIPVDFGTSVLRSAMCVDGGGRNDKQESRGL